MASAHSRTDVLSITYDTSSGSSCYPSVPQTKIRKLTSKKARRDGGSFAIGQPSQMPKNLSNFVRKPKKVLSSAMRSKLSAITENPLPMTNKDDNPL
ncbi:uncharacterized protein FOMMEDRAFT_22209 [Fomitiporia mediterranea MF3/22]|uniref:uncharacterized protein n=1 Tax=Fomitiporia mediterranea (strain MF3/22) TaxID=694068 RepID=UPI00044077ED|nr:uncharacterized protein FOMMEDRAFT_22209 [Fomitiporia mediterranea MF3/22]EJD00394.1 hypothetical protein FOMMEDRAFT_22209 [Fomitiporia mediterranea MF3/22]